MKTFLARYYERGTAYAMCLNANSYNQARSRCARQGWKLEEDAAQEDDGYRGCLVS